MGLLGPRDHAGAVVIKSELTPRSHHWLQFCGGVSQQVSECQERKRPGDTGIRVSGKRFKVIVS